jgi:pyruvate dehydrogenase E2 component (dihydrolipoamide acetyltransferase)
MPSLGADMDTGTIVEWRVQPGDVVHRGDIVAVVDTEKSDIEVEVFEDGVIEELLVEPGREVHVGTPLARIGTTEHVRASPRARRLAAEQGRSLTDLAGTGPGGAVVGADVAEGGPPPAPVGGRAPAAGRRVTGELMARSKQEIPHYYVASTIDLDAALGWLAATNDGRSPAERLLPAALLLRATALAAVEVPTMNGTWDGTHHPSEQVHLGVVITQRGGGLVAPAIRDAESLPVGDLMARLADLVERARSGRLRGSEVTGATLTVSNLGAQGADEVFAVIHRPQVAIVGFGRVVQRPWAVDGMLAVRPTIRATVSGDHRVSDGHEASRFLRALDRLLQQPDAL